MDNIVNIEWSVSTSWLIVACVLYSLAFLLIEKCSKSWVKVPKSSYVAFAFILFGTITAGMLSRKTSMHELQKSVASATLNKDGSPYPSWWNVIYTDGTKSVCTHCEQIADKEWSCEDCLAVDDFANE